MTQVEKLEHVGILSNVRQRLGAKDENDESLDEKINKLSNSKCIGLSMGWELGDDSWWHDAKGQFDELEELDK